MKREMDEAVLDFARGRDEALEAHVKACAECRTEIEPPAPGSHCAGERVVFCGELDRLLDLAVEADRSAFWCGGDDAEADFLACYGQADADYIKHCHESYLSEIVRSADDPEDRRFPEED